MAFPMLSPEMEFFKLTKHHLYGVNYGTDTKGTYADVIDVQQ